MTQQFRQAAVRGLTSHIGVYALVDLDGHPLYVGQSVDGIKSRVRRHLTSARSDVIANRQVDIWEVAEVWAWPAARDEIGALEAALFRHYDAVKTLMNGSIPTSSTQVPVIDPTQRVVVLDDTERQNRRIPSVRLPRQIEHYNRLVDYILTVKDAPHLRRSVRAHYERLSRYHRQFLDSGTEVLGSEDAAEG